MCSLVSYFYPIFTTIKDTGYGWWILPSPALSISVDCSLCANAFSMQELYGEQFSANSCIVSHDVYIGL